MRRLLIVAAGAAAMLAAPAPAPAQHHGGGQWQARPGGSWHWNGQGPRWGGTVRGRWHGGAQAPGGWAAYRRPARGQMLPSYWVSPGWAVRDWADYGLYPPPRGYSWSRYYDDAVLIDASGQVWDSRSDVDWDAYDQGYDDGYRDAIEDGRGEAVVPPPPPSPPPPAGMRYPEVEVMRGGVPVDGARVTTTCVGDCGGTVDGGWFYPAATETTITIPPGKRVVTTTTTAHPAETYVIERTMPVSSKTLHRPSKTVHRPGKAIRK